MEQEKIAQTQIVKTLFLKSIIQTILIVALVWGLVYVWQGALDKTFRYFLNIKDDYKSSLLYAIFYSAITIVLVYYLNVNIQNILG